MVPHSVDARDHTKTTPENNPASWSSGGFEVRDENCGKVGGLIVV
jgi:hypothetical protein